MASKGLKSGTRLRYLNGEKLEALQDILEALPYKVDVVEINRVGNQWYIHFYIPPAIAVEMPIQKENQNKKVKGEL